MKIFANSFAINHPAQKNICRPLLVQPLILKPPTNANLTTQLETTVETIREEQHLFDLFCILLTLRWKSVGGEICKQCENINFICFFFPFFSLSPLLPTCKSFLYQLLFAYFITFFLSASFLSLFHQSFFLHYCFLYQLSFPFSITLYLFFFLSASFLFHHLFSSCFLSFYFPSVFFIVVFLFSISY